ncbi:hypothetical protein V5N11_020815 [Cardamine amara subsp. amara]|uniref:Agenet domain-containing protein n=1 Tax=Cardamine amara subsp. amara TaxID=228776 RepID=A0ABD1AI67_CARAN
MLHVKLPFKVGHTVEVRSFENGFRGAWFLCKILKIYMRGNALYYNLKYIDYPGEGIHKTKVFQKLEGEDKIYLMIRPVRPRHCHENQVPNTEAGLEEALVVHGFWKVGDMIDWWTDYCYWSGTILEVKEDESLKIELWPPPYGEGCVYDALSKDLRPSLEWSLRGGWTVPFTEDGEKRQCAKLMKLSNEDQVSGVESREEKTQRPTCDVTSDEMSGDESREEETQRPTCDGTSDQVMSGAESTEEETQRSTEKLEEETQIPTQNFKGHGDLRLNIMESESIEAAVLDMEELIVRFEWLKDKLNPNSSEKSSWKYEDYCQSSSRM